ncbi:DUF11 domain-containing protein [Romboutsia weinsteinii]|uniref:DUF11 domain-containing protein n=2 Tax=Romboutsia weinsteinii TaxID=2020949 RepID=A0A371J718_9FIRM|nr:DUF11 domain-containing protein [Romboutsia weinsteinii]
MSLMSRFSTVDKSILVATGNSLVVCGSTTSVGNNTSDMIKPDGTTTRDYKQAGSSASLNILANSYVQYAELIWYSTVKSNVQGATDLRSLQDSQVTFTTSKGSYQITPKYTDSFAGASGSIDRYRAADVTAYVQDALSGTYTVSNVPISLPEAGLSNSRAGWTLTVIYRNDSFLPQKILYSSGIATSTSDLPLQTSLTGFTTDSEQASLKGSIFLACANGEPLNGEDIVSAGPSFAQLTNIGNVVYSPNSNPGTAPNNPGNKFFSGIINVADPLSSSNGLLNIVGTNGINNNDGFVPTQSLGARNKWDITNVDITKSLITNQTLLAGQIISNGSGDGLQLVAMGTQVNAQAPNITAELVMYDIDGDDEYNIEAGEFIVYAVKIKNDGSVPANNIILSAALDTSTTFVPGSVTINTIKQSNVNITNGINIDSIPPKGILNVLFTVRVNSVPTGGLLSQNVNYSYQFTSGSSTITNSGKTNSIQVIVQDGLLSINKSASKTSASVGDIVTYTIDIENIGTELATNMFFQDKIDLSCSFVNGSVVIDGVSYPNYDPTQGISLPNLEPNNNTEIILQSKVNSLPPSTKVTNDSCISFGYIFDQYGYIREKTIFSNVVSIQVQYVDIVGERCGNNNYPNVGDTVTYNLRLTNIGNMPANNIQVLEPPIPGATFISSSVKINGVTEEDLNPFNGFTLEDPINPLQSTNIEYKVLVNQINPSGIIENIAQVPYKYQISPGSGDIDSEEESNMVKTIANYVCMNISETVDKEYATVGDTLYYNVKISNNGNINATNTVFLSNLAPDTSFVPGTVTINGISYPAYNPTQGFTVDTICLGEEIEVTYQAKVNSVPIPNIVYNQSSLVYSYKPDPNGNILTGTINSNTVQTIINKADYKLTKTVDKSYAQVGDNLVYTTTIENTGTVDLSNIKFADYIGVYLKFYPGSIYINGENYPDYNPESQFTIDDLHPGDTATITFGVTIIGNPPVGYVPNMSEATLTYQQTPNSPIITKTVYSNEVNTYVPYAKLNLTKNVDKSYASVGETLTYSFTATNTGNTNVFNTFFSDTLQTELSFVTRSVYINGISKPSYDPQVGFDLGNIVVGQSVTVSFKAKVENLPNPNSIKNNAITSYSYNIDPNGQPITRTTTSNTVTTIINSYTATLTKQVDKMYATIGDTLNYTVTVNNTGTVSLTSVNFIDIIPNEAIFVDGSVVIDGVSKPDYNPNLGFLISNVLPGGNVVVMFKVRVASLPTPPQINNSSTINFKYQLSPTSSINSGTLTSNTVTTNIVSTSVTNTKSANKMYATVGDTITYTSVITNNGNIDITNTKFTDIIPMHTTFVVGSVKINQQSQVDYDPNIGFSLGTIYVGSSVTVTFDITVDSVPNKSQIANTSTINYDYNIDPNGYVKSETVASNTVITYINLGSMTVTKSANRTKVRLNNVITYNFVISNTGNTVLKNILFTDKVQSESSFNTGSVVVNGESKSSYNPNNGFSLSDIQIGQQTTVSFTVTVNSLPSENKLLNKADVDYSYYVDPNGSLTSKTTSSNTTTVFVYDTIMSANKMVDKATAKIGEILNFTIEIKNEGNVNANSVHFEDMLDPNIEFVQDSVYENGNQRTGYNPNDGFSLDDIDPNSTTTVTFKATVTTRPADNLIYNFASIDYQYTVDTDVINANIDTNTTKTYVAVGELTLTKSVDKAYATVGDNIHYSIRIKNTGSVAATNLNFKDIISASASFNTNSVVVDGLPQLDFNPIDGFTLSDLLPNEYHTVTFSIKVDSLPASGKIENSADTTFTYQLTPTDTPVDATATSNKVTTLILLGKLTVTKTVDKAYETVGNNLTYTIKIANEGNTNSTNVFVQDLIQIDARFVNGSVIVNGVSKPTYDPNIGFNLDDIPANDTATVSFVVTVQSIPPVDYTIYNHSLINYEFYVDPSNLPVQKQSISNTVATIINVGSLVATKSVSKSYATIGDVLTYTINVFNSGNVLAKNVNFRDVIPNGLIFVQNSVSINGISYQGYDPYESFTLGNIVSGDTVVVKFDVNVTSLQIPSLVSNTAQLTFAYKVNPSGDDIYAQANSNSVTTQINVGSLKLTKSVDLNYVTKGDVLTYKVIVNNDGNVDTKNVIFTDNLQSDLTFNQGSVKIDGTAYPDYNPINGFRLGDIASLGSVTVTFTATVVEQPIRNSVLNFAIASFSYKIDPNGSDYSHSAQSNTVSSFIIMPILVNIKTVDKTYSTLQDTLNYSILVKNAGNTTINQLFFSDVLSNGATFKASTVTIDGVSYSTYDPIVGFNLPNDLVAGNTSLIKFQAIINAIPSPPQVTNYAVSNGMYKINPQGVDYPISATSNTVTTNINVGNLSNTKSVDKMYAKVNDTVSYTSTITNIGNINATNIRFIDSLQNEVTYISGTVRINNVLYPALDPTLGFDLSDLAAGQTVTVAFDAKINSLPTPPYITNISQTQFSYKVDPSGSLATNTQFSNSVTTNVVLGKITTSKIVDKPIATIGDTLVYTVTLTNVGNVIDNDVYFQDIPSTGARFTSGSVKINGINQTSYDPTAGFSLGDIGIGEVVTVEFSASVVSVPSSNQITNQAVITFKYVVDPKQAPYSDTTYSNKVTTNIAYGNLSVTKEVNKQYATVGERLTYTITIINKGNINATNVVFLDPTPRNSVFVLGSVVVNGVAHTDYNPSAGFNLNTMTPGQIITVVYQVQVIDLC